MVYAVVEGYNNLEVSIMAIPRECLKALIDRLTDKQVEALWVILEAMTWPSEEITPEEAAEIEDAFREIDAGKGVKAEDVWKELGL